MLKMKSYMKKIFYAFFAVVLTMACTPDNQEYQPDTTLYRTGTVNLCASIEEIQTRMVMDLTGRSLWSEGDRIAVACDDGSFVEFELNGIGETKRAIFTGEIPQGKTLGNVAVWPASAVVGMEGNTLTLKTPTEYSTDNIAYDGIMVANISDSWEITFRHVMSRPTFKISGVPSYTSYIVLEAENYTLGGRLSMDVASEDGLTGVKGKTTPLMISLVEAGSTVAVTVNVPVAEYPVIKAILYDENDEVIHEQHLNEVSLMMSRAVTSTFSSKLVGIVERLDPVDVEYIEVCGIKWAKGNLQAKQGVSQKGMQDGWRIAPAQWHFFKYQEAYDNAVKNGNGNPYKYDYSNSQSEFEHFTYGALSRNARFFSDAESNWMKPLTEGFDIQGKIFSDRNGKVEVTGRDRWANAGSFGANNSEIYGDLAFWASRGAYMTPTYAQLEKLRTEADAQAGYVFDGETKIWGTYFCDAAVEGAPVFNNVDREITAAELEKGIFLPKAGRRTNNKSDSVMSATQQATYRASTYIGSGVCNAGSEKGRELNYSYAFHFPADNAAYLWQTSTTSAYDNGAGFLIRPIVNDAYDPDNI